MHKDELKEGDYNPYYGTYIDKVGNDDLLEILKKQANNFPEFINSLPEDEWHYAYAESKWTILEVLQHIIDTERVFQYRALRFSRNDKTPLPGFDQDQFVPESMANTKDMKTIIAEYKATREATIQLFTAFGDDVLKRIGTASDSPMSVAALGFVICGHQRHHRDCIRERYL